jgi:DNA polymerase-4
MASQPEERAQHQQGHTWPRAIAHIDLDQFYAAVEILDFPDLKGLPLIVGGRPDSRGVVCTASYEARKFGVRSAMSSAQAARLCPQATWRAPRMSRYAEKSREVLAVFERFTDDIEPLSLDEAFLDLTGSIKLFGPPEQIAQRIKAEIFRDTGLVGSVGLATNKYLAKVASDLKKPNGFVIVPPGAEQARAFLAPLPVSRLWGAGPKTTARLQELGFQTIGQIASADAAFLARRIGAQAAEHLIALANGEDDRDVDSSGNQKSIGRENTFAQDVHDLDAMEKELLAFADEVAARLRHRHIRAAGMALKVRFSDFSRISRAYTFEEPTDLAEPLYQAACDLLRTKVSFNGRGVRLLGIAATRLMDASDVTGTLFTDEDATRKRSVAKAIDHLRARFGDASITRGRLLEGRERNTGTPTERKPDL